MCFHGGSHPARARTHALSLQAQRANDDGAQPGDAAAGADRRMFGELARGGGLGGLEVRIRDSHVGIFAGPIGYNAGWFSTSLYPCIYVS